MAHRVLSTFDILKDVYGTETRKGINKLSIEHPIDCIDNCHIEEIDDLNTSVRVFRVGLLHDVVKKSEVYDAEYLRHNSPLDDEDIELLNVLTRDVENEDGSSYLDGILKREDAIIIKLGDRISSARDLLLWHNRHDCFDKECLTIAKKHLSENEYLLNAMALEFKNRTPIKHQIAELEALMDTIKEKMVDINEEAIMEGVFDNVKSFKNIQDYDIEKTMNIVKDLYTKSSELKKAYPDFLPRLKKVIDRLEKAFKDKGFKYVQELFNKVNFTSDDFLKEYIEHVNTDLVERISKIKDLREKTPKEGLRKSIKEKLAEQGWSGDTILDDFISSNEPEKLNKVYNAITEIINADFEYLEGGLQKITKRYGGELIYRPDKFKANDRAIVKYLESNVENPQKVSDFLDLTDIMGFRARFDNAGEAVDFALDMVKDPENYVFKLNKYTGKGSAYQGVNINSNFEGKFNYELQSVIDYVQIATDLNHDVIYKKILKVSAQEKDAIVMMVQICLALLFDELFDFKKFDAKKELAKIERIAEGVEQREILKGAMGYLNKRR